jgi:hypothetical protein
VAPVPPPVAIGTSTEVSGVLEVMLAPMKMQDDIGVRIKNVEESHVDSQVPEPTLNRDGQADKRVKNWFAVARGKVPSIYSVWNGTDGAEHQVKGYSG